MRYEQIRVKGIFDAQAVAFGAHSLRAVEAEKLRAGRFEREATVSAGVGGGEDDVAVAGVAARLALLFTILGSARVSCPRRIARPKVSFLVAEETFGRRMWLGQETGHSIV